MARAKLCSDGTFVAKWGSEGWGEAQFMWPKAVAVDSECFVYVANTRHGRMQKFTGDGQFVAKWSHSYAPADSMLCQPVGLAVDWEGFVYVTDEGNHRIQVFKPRTREVAP